MNIALKRTEFGEEFTIGVLSIDGAFECYTLEDKVREVDGQPVGMWKVKGQTAIPRGRYQVIRDMSVRLKRILPLLVAVPGFAGIRIHPGNTAEDTEGCLLVGTQKDDHSVLNSRTAFAALDQKIKAAIALGEQVWITIA